jgi:alanine racemase
MARLGAPWDALEPIARELGRARRVRLAATFSHLACAEEADGAFTREQARRFETAVAALREHGIDPGELHLANSGGLLHHPELRRFGARPGIALYGYPPAPERTTLALRPALRLCSEIGRLADLAPGASVGYNRRFVAAAPTRAATVPIGYADGYRRGLTGRAEVIVRDRRAPLLGAVSMDMVVVDVTAIRQAAVGDEVVLLGSTPSCRVDAADLAAAAGTIPYEILCGISARVPRRYT